ncbi:MAG: transcriptional regulator [Nocardioidaceae bacterium]|nr:MAG: transcriptional regulator [Nocardioidaceae bacterium]
MVRAQAEPVTLAALVSLSGLHANTLREHLDGLSRMGLVERHSAKPRGRGRPAALYQATDNDLEPMPEYAGLAAALAATIHRTSSAPSDDAADAGLEWGRDLARARGAAPSRSEVVARREVVALLEELGFAPRTDSRVSTVRLTRCPLLEAAYRYPEIVCAVHRGLTQGALAAYGGDPDNVELIPFAEPGACLLHLTADSAG